MLNYANDLAHPKTGSWSITTIKWVGSAFPLWRGALAVTKAEVFKIIWGIEKFPKNSIGGKKTKMTGNQVEEYRVIRKKGRCRPGRQRRDTDLQGALRG